MKIVIVATYYNRQSQLEKTLQSIKSTHDNFEMVIIDDNSPDNIQLPKTTFPVTIIKTKDKDWTDRDIPANIGFHEALKRGADIIISQNAECYHVSDIIKYARKVTDGNYISFACFSMGEEIRDPYNLDEIIKGNDKVVTKTGGTGWYNHPDHRPTGYDFCAAMTRNTLIKLNGFDERYSYGIAYGDGDHVRRLRRAGIRIDIPVNPFVVHQYHYSEPIPGRDKSAVTRNKELFLRDENNIKAVHLKTPDFK